MIQTLVEPLDNYIGIIQQNRDGHWVTLMHPQEDEPGRVSTATAIIGCPTCSFPTMHDEPLIGHKNGVKRN